MTKTYWGLEILRTFFLIMVIAGFMLVGIHKGWEQMTSYTWVVYLFAVACLTGVVLVSERIGVKEYIDGKRFKW